MDKINSDKLILNMVNFYTLFNIEFADLIPDLTNSEITPLLSKIINFIHLEGATTSSKISKKLNITVPNASRSINALNNLGYIVKRQDLKDKRITYLSLSPKAIEHIISRNAVTDIKFLEKFNVLSNEEIDELLKAFFKLQNLFIKMRDLNKNIKSTKKS